MRRAETFTQPWIHEAVVVNESQRLAERLQELQNGPTTTGAAAAGGQAA